MGIYHIEAENTGHVERTEALGDWGTGDDYQLKIIDAEGNADLSDYFTIE